MDVMFLHVGEDRAYCSLVMSFFPCVVVRILCISADLHINVDACINQPDGVNVKLHLVSAGGPVRNLVICCSK
jgi:hypothetical protein